jgi:hypothetical protein
MPIQYGPKKPQSIPDAVQQSNPGGDFIGVNHVQVTEALTS